MNIIELRRPAIKTKLKTINKNLLLRPISLNDEIELHQELGRSYFAAIGDADLNAIAAIYYHQLIDKSAFNETELIIKFPDGTKDKTVTSGLDLLKRLIVANDDQTEVIRCVTEIVAISNPEIGEQLKKKSVRHLARWKRRRVIISTISIFCFGIIIGHLMTF